jgi:hypothetical protein
MPAFASMTTKTSVILADAGIHLNRCVPAFEHDNKTAMARDHGPPTKLASGFDFLLGAAPLHSSASPERLDRAVCTFIDSSP